MIPKPAPKRRGRPPKPKGELHTERLPVLLTAEQRKRLGAWAEEAGVSDAEYVRERLFGGTVEE